MLWWIHTVHLITKLISKLHILFTAFDKTPEDMKLEIKINANRGCLWTHTVIQFLQIKVRELSDHARSRQNDKLTSSCSQQKEKKVNLMISLTWAKLFQILISALVVMACLRKQTKFTSQITSKTLFKAYNSTSFKDT